MTVDEEANFFPWIRFESFGLFLEYYPVTICPALALRINTTGLLCRLPVFCLVQPLVKVKAGELAALALDKPLSQAPDCRTVVRPPLK